MGGHLARYVAPFHRLSYVSYGNGVIRICDAAPNTDYATSIAAINTANNNIKIVLLYMVVSFLDLFRGNLLLISLL